MRAKCDPRLPCLNLQPIHHKCFDDDDEHDDNTQNTADVQLLTERTCHDRELFLV